MLLCYGDSITAGVPGVSYCRFFPPGLAFRNEGVGGDTVGGLLARLEQGPDGPRDDDLVVLEIGTNDLLLPFLSGYSPSWKFAVRGVLKRGRVPAEDKAAFLRSYARILETLRGVRVAAVSIPCIGEDPDSGLNGKVDGYNEVIRELCSRSGAVYVDYMGRQKSFLRSRGGGVGRFMSPWSFMMPIDVLVTSIPGWADRIAERRNLALTIDGVHPNSRGARTLAGMILDACAAMQEDRA